MTLCLPCACSRVMMCCRAWEVNPHNYKPMRALSLCQQPASSAALRPKHDLSQQMNMAATTPAAAKLATAATVCHSQVFISSGQRLQHVHPLSLLHQFVQVDDSQVLQQQVWLAHTGDGRRDAGQGGRQRQHTGWGFQENEKRVRDAVVDGWRRGLPATACNNRGCSWGRCGQ